MLGSEPSGKKRGPSFPRAFAVAAVGVVGAIGVIGRTLAAMRNGDDLYVRVSVISAVSVAAFLLIFTALLCAQFLPGLLRSRTVARLHPDALVFTARMNADVSAFLLARVRPLGSVGIPRVSCAMSADHSGLHIWAGHNSPTAIAQLPWNDVKAVRTTTRLVNGRHHPALSLEIEGVSNPLVFRVSRPRSLGAGILRNSALRDLADRLAGLAAQNARAS